MGAFFVVFGAVELELTPLKIKTCFREGIFVLFCLATKMLLYIFLTFSLCFGLGEGRHTIPHHQIHHLVKEKVEEQVVCGYYGPAPTEICAQEKFYHQQLDHFRYDNDARRTWKQRYLENTEFFGKPNGEESPLKLPSGCEGPILFYTGNEGPIDAFWGANGFMIADLAPKWGAALLFPEERYYGKSMPFGADSLSPEHAVYLSTEQVLADYAELLTAWKEQNNATSCPVVAFGGSYGGTLTTYFRRIYPTLTVGGLAASAPIGYYSNSEWPKYNVNQYTWIDIVQKVFSTTEYGEKCFDRLLASVEAVRGLGETEEGLARLVKGMHVCSVQDLGTPCTNFYTDALETMPQEDYPFPIGSSPAWPVNTTCQMAMETDDLIELAFQITDMFYGYDGSGCIDVEGEGGIPGGGPGPASWSAWAYQSCTETLHSFSSKRGSHGFRDWVFNYSYSADECESIYGVRPNQQWAEQHWGGYGIGEGRTGVTNLIWSNGELDPWGGGGFLEPFENDMELYWFWMPQGAHHLDLWASMPNDPVNVTDTRNEEERIIRRWVEESA